jgi:gamma-butyrobetaine dioxygenase
MTGDRLDLGFSNGSALELHLFWLRDNCRCPACWHSIARERAFDLMSLPPELGADVEITAGGALAVAWSGDGHRSLFDARWLLEHARAPEPRPRRRPWGADLADRIPTVAYDAVMHSDEGLHAWCRLLRDDGIAIVRGAPPEPMEVARVGRRIGFVWTHYPGEIHDVRPRPDPDSLAYTRLPLPLHTDLPARISPPGVQLLHCLINDATEGDSLVSDGLSVSIALRESSPDLHRVLTEQPVEFRFASPTVDYRCEAPILEYDAGGELHRVRCNSPLIVPPYLPWERTDLLYRAYRAFLATAADRRHLVQLRLRAGDILSLDNHRVLHGRNAFDPSSGARHLRSCYLDHDELTCRLRILARGSRQETPA